MPEVSPLNIRKDSQMSRPIRWTLVAILFLAQFGASCRNNGSEIRKKSFTLGTKNSNDPNNPANDNALASNLREKEALVVLEKHCYSCHGKDGSNAGSIGNILDINGLKERKLMSPNQLEESKIYQRMISIKQPMPPAGMLPQAEIDIIGNWILEYGKSSRTFIPYADVYKAIETDFNAQPDKANTRYFHLVNQYNSNAPDSDLDVTRKGLSKILNMLSTSSEIIVPEAIDDKNLIYRVNLKKYDLDRPETLYTYMLKNIFPTLTDDLKLKWLPQPDERDPRNYYGARFKESFEGKGTVSPFIQPNLHTFKDGLPLPNDPILKSMARKMREAGQIITTSPLKYGEIAAEETAETAKCQTEEKPVGVSCSNPIPLIRANWFIAQVSANMRMRLYYHIAGMDDDTVTLDAALGIDDVEGFLLDNDPNYDPAASKKEPIIRAGFNNSGVSQNHRAIERIPLDYVSERPLWRGYEFKDKSLPGNEEYDIFEYPVGPFFEISVEDEPGYECINLLTPAFTTIPRLGTSIVDRVRFLRLLDIGLLYPSQLPNGQEPKLVKELKAIAPTPGSRIPNVKESEFRSLLEEFESLYQHRDYFTHRASDYIAKYGALPTMSAEELGMRRMVECEAPKDMKTFRHESLEYLFLKRNGMQAFVNVGLSAEHLDYKVPNQRAIQNKEALLIPAHDNPNQLVVGAPISCLSCHTKGYIEKEDMVKSYVNQSEASAAVKEKINRVHVDFDALKVQMEKDNTIFRDSLKKAGISVSEKEPIVENYRNWAIPGLSLSQVASELDLTPETLQNLINTDKSVGFLLRELKISGSTIKRSEFERSYFDLMCAVHKHCITVPKENIIPAQ